jgi:hypothetical protein
VSHSTGVLNLFLAAGRSCQVEFPPFCPPTGVSRLEARPSFAGRMRCCFAFAEFPIVLSPGVLE